MNATLLSKDVFSAMYEWNGLTIAVEVPHGTEIGRILVQKVEPVETPNESIGVSDRVRFAKTHNLLALDVEVESKLHRAAEALMAGEVCQTIDWLKDNYPGDCQELNAYLEST